MGFQDPATAVAEGMIDLHADVMFFMWMLATFYLYLILRTCYLFDESRHPRPVKILHNTTLEVVWTLIPCAILIVIAISSFALLYAEEVTGLLDDYAGLTLKVTGRQWYWSYKYPEFMSDFDGDSYMIQDDDLELGQMRNLEVDNRVVLPVNTPLRFVITGADVVHAWAVPSLGIKVDAIPGRLNQVNTIIKRPGVFYGQCSELCGVLHYAMPICVVALPPDDDLWH